MDIIFLLAQLANLRHTIHVASTNAIRFGDLESHWRTTAAKRYFYVRTSLQAFYGRALAGIPSGMPGSYVSGSPTLPCARPPHLAMGRGFTAHIGGHDMAALPHPAHSAHTFPLTEKEARRAARLWFTGAPTASLAQWRDERCHAHCGGLPADTVRAAAFNAAFAGEIANIIAGVSHD